MKTLSLRRMRGIRGPHPARSGGTRERHAPDYTLLILVSIVIFIGLIMLASATSIISLKETNGSYFYLRKQISHGLIPGIAALLITLRINYSRYRKFTPLWLLLTFILLLMVYIPGLGTLHNNVRSWVQIGSFSFQTSEIAKLTFVLWLASWLNSREHSLRNFFKTSLPFFIILGAISVLLLRQPDTGTAMIFVCIALCMFLSQKVNLLHFSLFTGLGLLMVLAFIAPDSYKVNRLINFLHPEQDIQGSGYQIRQGLIALGSGSWLGVGVGKSQQKFQFVPEIESDSIFSIIGEETGFLFSATLLVLYACIFLRGIRIMQKIPDRFGALVSFGFILTLTIQVLINVGAMVGLLPLTGIPLPFISLGGTNMVVLLASVGIVTNISQYTSS